MHSWIRFFECILNISYIHGIEKWELRDEYRQILNERKEEVLRRFWEIMSLLVDKPKANCGGITNDGNHARLTFNQPEILARSTNADQSLIQNFKIILISLHVNKCSILRNLKHSFSILLIYTRRNIHGYPCLQRFIRS